VHEYLSASRYEEVELRICRQWLRSGDACLDIGANIGLMTARFAACVGSKGIVVSVEPAPSTYAFLRQGMQLLGYRNVRLEQACVADRTGPVPFMVATSEGSDVEASMKIDTLNSGRFSEVIAAAVTIDGLVEKHRIAERLSLVKIDIEGAEPMALRSSSLVFHQDRLPLFVTEVHKGALANFGLKPLDVLQFFPGELFELFHVQRSRSDLMPQFDYGRPYALPVPKAHAWPWYSNLIAVPRIGRYAQRRLKIAGLLPP
jgi:FkbM family methyltransferase